MIGIRGQDLNFQIGTQKNGFVDWDLRFVFVFGVGIQIKDWYIGIEMWMRVGYSEDWDQNLENKICFYRVELGIGIWRLEFDIGNYDLRLRFGIVLGFFYCCGVTELMKY